MTELTSGMKGYKSEELSFAEGNNFGHTLRAIRAGHNWSQRTLAAIGGIAESTIAKMEAGSRKPIKTPEFYRRIMSNTDIALEEKASIIAGFFSDMFGIDQQSMDTMLQQTRDSETKRRLELRRVSAGGVHVDYRVVSDPHVLTFEETTEYTDVAAIEFHALLNAMNSIVQRRKNLTEFTSLDIPYFKTPSSRLATEY